MLLNPLGAQTPTLPYQPSPYYASTRRFRNAVYLRVEDVEGAKQVDLAQEREAALPLNTGRLIDYDRVFQLKAAALEKIFRAAPRPRGLASYVARQGRALRTFATFNALCETYGPTWRSWPSTPTAPDPERVAFHEWLQFHLDRQLARASREIGLITDVPVACAWARRRMSSSATARTGGCHQSTRGGSRTRGGSPSWTQSAAQAGMPRAFDSTT